MRAWWPTTDLDVVDIRGGREGGREGGRGGMTVIHILMAPQYLNNNHVTYYVIT